MSGLAAHLARQRPTDPSLVERALRAAPHRGSLIEVVVHGSCALGVVRHDPSDAASLTVADGLGVAVAGVVDNLNEIATSLRGRGAVPLDASTAGMILSAYQTFGNELLPMLRGAFAIAITDGRTLRGLRDQVGWGTVFHRDDPRGTWLASEAKQVIAGAGLSKEPDVDLLEAIFYGYRDDDMPTVLRGVNRLPKASVLEADVTQTRVRRYWDPTSLVETGRTPQAELKPTFDRLMARAVDRVLRGDDIVALSGGIDSPAVAAFAADAYAARFDRPLPALSMIFPDYPSADESVYIKEVVERLGLQLHPYQPPADASTLAPLDRWTELTDGPWMGWWEPGMDEDRYRRLRSLGLANLLTGDFAEYEMALPFDIVAHLMWKGRFGPLLRLLRDQRRRGTSRKSIGRQLASTVLPGSFFRWYRAVRPRWPVPDWIDPKRLTPTSPTERLAPWARWGHHQLAGFLGPGLPFEAYQIFNEAQRISIRWPWADVDLWEFFVGLPAELKFPGAQPKQLVRGFIRGRVPDSIVERPVNTVLDEFVQRSFDYVSLRRWIDPTEFRMPGIDYPRFWARLERGNLQNYEYVSAKDLAQVHAFLSLWTARRSAG